MKNTNKTADLKRLEKIVAELSKAVDQLRLAQLYEGAIVPQPAVKMGDKILIIQKIVSENSRVTLKDLTESGQRGNEKFTNARMIGMSLCWIHRLGTTGEISHRFGKKDHSSVSYADKRCSILMEVSSQFRALYNKCKLEAGAALNTELEPDFEI
ncbi:MAG: helix-turn-helix domain-containing protein [Patescibacteria group bacterium]